MIVTKEKIIDELEKFSNLHAEIFSFSHGDLRDISTKDTEYPLLHIAPSGGNIKSSSILLSFDMFILDLERQDKSNLRSILSKTLLIGVDVVNNFFETAEIEGEYDLWTISDENVNFKVAEFKFDDVLAGYLFKVNIEVINKRNKCLTPFN